MKVFISADIEGCTGIVSFSQCSRPGDDFFDYSFARRMMTQDVNAAIRGAKSAGATEIVVKDGHGNCKNLLIEDLEPGAELISGYGSGKDGMMQGIDESFDSAMLVGYHAMAGTPNALMEHALVGGLHRFWINGQPAGEIAASAAVAGDLDVPLVLVTSDDAGAQEAADLIPTVARYSTKSGIGKYTGKVKHPNETTEGIFKAAKDGCARAKEIAPYALKGPITMRAEFHSVEEADLVATLESIIRLDGYTVEWTRTTFREAHSFGYNAFAMSIRGRTSRN